MKPSYQFKKIMQVQETIKKRGSLGIDTSVHVSGHSSALEQKLLIAMTKPNHVIPIGGNYRHMIQYRSLARSLGYKDNKIHLLDNGMVVSVTPEEVKVINTLDLQQMSVTNQ